MDVTVDYLIHRLSRQLPAELPLGLVYVVGTVGEVWPTTAENGATDTNGRFPVGQFELINDDHSLRCVALHAAGHVDWLTPGVRVRAGGQLAFDNHRAAYTLLAQELDLVPPSDDAQQAGARQALRDTLAGVKKRAGATDLAAGELPPWVQNMLQAATDPDAVADEPVPEANAAPPLPDAATAVPGRESLSPELVDALSTAMDSDSDVALTPDLLATYGSPPAELPVENRMDAESVQALSTTYTPEPVREDTDWLVILLIVTFSLLIVALVATAVVLLNAA